jgi:hypothetical protein
MERSHLTAVIIGPLEAHAIDALLQALRAAASLPTWRCPNLMFLVPPNAVWITQKIHEVNWPSPLNVHVLSESMTGASSVWNAMLGWWSQVKSRPAWPVPAHPSVAGLADFPIKVSELTPSPRTTPPLEPTTAVVGRTDTARLAAEASPSVAPAPSPPARNPLDPSRARQALAGMLAFEGLVGCAIVDGSTGLALLHEWRDPQHPDIELAAGAAAQVMRAHRMAARSMGLIEQVDEVMTSAGPRQQIMRTVSRHPDLFLWAQLEKHRTNLALARFQLMEIERALA